MIKGSLKAALRALASSVPFYTGLGLLIAGIVSSRDLLAIAGALLWGAFLVGRALPLAAKELGVALVACERVRAKSAAPAPELPDLGDVMAGVAEMFGGAKPAAYVADVERAGEAHAAHTAERMRGTVPVEVRATPTGKPLFYVPVHLLTVDEASTREIEPDRWAEILSAAGEHGLVRPAEFGQPSSGHLAVSVSDGPTSEAWAEGDNHEAPEHGIPLHRFDDLDDPARMPPF